MQQSSADDVLTITGIIMGGGKNIDQKRDYIPPGRYCGITQCTMALSPCKMGNREFESDYHHRPHFLAVQLFQTEISAARFTKSQLQFKQSAGRM